MTRSDRRDLALALAIGALAVIAVLAAVLLLRVPVHGTRPQIALVDELPVSPGASMTVDAVQVTGRRVAMSARPIVIRAGDHLTFAGWAIDAAAHDAASAVVASVDGREAIASYGAQRDDVARAYANPRYAKSGFEVTIPARYLGKGTHLVRWLVVSGSATRVYEGKPTAVTVR